MAKVKAPLPVRYLKGQIKVKYEKYQKIKNKGRTMEKNRDIERVSEEDEFSIVVLDKAKKLFGKHAKYLKIARMVKLVAFVAEEIGYDLTRGWYRYGAYSPNAFTVARDFSDEDLPTFNPPKELIESASERFREQIRHIDRAVKNLEPFFVRNREKFYKWVYGVKAPEKYRGFYLTHQHFINFLNFIDSPDIFRFYFNKRFDEIESVVTDFYDNIRFKDDDVRNLFYFFMDLFEIVALKLIKNDYRIGTQELYFLRTLKEFYYHGPEYSSDLWFLLVPYSETLAGMSAHAERERHQRKVDFTKKELQVNLTDLYDLAESTGFLRGTECYGYKVFLMEEEKGFTVKSLELPTCVSQGESESEAIENMKGAILSYLEYKGIPLKK